MDVNKWKSREGLEITDLGKVTKADGSILQEVSYGYLTVGHCEMKRTNTFFR